MQRALLSGYTIVLDAGKLSSNRVFLLRRDERPFGTIIVRDHRLELLLLARVCLLGIGHDIDQGHSLESLHLLKVYVAFSVAVDGIKCQDVRSAIAVGLD